MSDFIEDLNPLSDFLIGVPATLTSCYIVREQFVHQIFRQLQDKDFIQGHLLVYGLPGTGKTIAVSQAVSLWSLSAPQEEDRPIFRVAYWTKIGNVDNGNLFHILIQLCIQMGLSWEKRPRDLDEVTPCIEQFLQANSHKFEILFIFDDIWDKSHLDYLTFAKKAVLTSRFNYPQWQENYHSFIKAPEQFTSDEVIQVLDGYIYNHNSQIVLESELMTRVIQSCQGLPLAISLLRSLTLETEEHWKEVIDIMESKPVEPKFPDYEFNLYDFIMMCINNLEPEKNELFQLLGVFKRIPIPFRSIMCLWKRNEAEVYEMMKVLDEKALITYYDNVDINARYCIIHDLIIDCLQQHPDRQEINQIHMAELNKNLVENYWQLWRKQQCNYKDDGYFYQHIIDHAIEARHKETLQGLMTDLKWMRAKVIACNTLHCLYADILKYMKSTHLSETTAIMDISELYDFLRQNQSYFNLEKMDFSQFLLSCSSHNSWIQEKALQIVDSKTKEDNFKFHVMMTAYPTPSFSYLTFWNNNKLIGRCWNDVLPRLSNGSIDNSKIISTHYNGTLDSCIVVIDNQTGDTKYKLPLPAIWVEEVRISSDSKLMAYSSQGTWKVCYIDSFEHLPFIDESGIKHTLECCNFEFLSCETTPAMLMTLSVDRMHIIIWEVSGNKIQRTTKSIASQQEITLFQTLPKGGKFLLLRKKYNQHQGQQEKDWVNECLIEIWNILPFFCHQSIRVPGRIKCDGNSYSISKHGNKAMELSHVQYTSNDYLNIVALYHSKAYKGSVLGLLTMVNRGNTSIDFITMWKRHFKIIHHDPKCINHSAISDDGQYLAILNGQGNLMVFRIDGNSISEYVIINCMQTIRQLLFVPTGYDLLTYDCSSQKLYGFTVTDRNLKWQKMDSESKIAFRQCHNEDYNCGKVLDSSCTFIDCIPYVTKLMKMNDESLRLIVYTGESLEAISKCNLGEYKCERKYSCFLFHNLDSIVVVQRYKCNQTHWTKLVTTSHWHFSLVQYDNIQMPAADSKQVEHIFDNSDYNLTITEAVYRASDKKLIFILKMLYPDLFQKFAIFIIDRPSGNKVIYCENVHNIQLSTMIYCDDRNCILHQWLINGDHAIKWYRIGDDINKSALVKEHQYKYSNGLACKIDTPNKKSLQDVNLLISPWDTISMLETFNTADTELFIKYSNKSKECCILQNGDEKMMFHLSRRRLFMKNYKWIGKFFDFNAVYQPTVNFPSTYWLNQFFIVLDRDHRRICFYDTVNMNLIQVYDSPLNFNLIRADCNKAQSLLLCQYENHQYGILKPVY